MPEISDRYVSKNGLIMTCDGVLFDVLNPRPESVTLDVIAHGLAKKDRASGHYNRVWSVADHSVFTAYAAEYYAMDCGLKTYEKCQCCIKALLHDASEAYLVDLPRPVKHLNGFEAYRSIEKDLQDSIYQWAALPVDQYDGIVHKADNEVLKCEFLWWLNGSERLEWVKDIDIDMVRHVQQRWPEMTNFRDWRESRDMFTGMWDWWNRRKDFFLACRG